MLRSLFNAAVFGLLTLFWSAAALLAAPWARSSVMTRIARRWALQVRAVCGVKVNFQGREGLDAPAYVVLANHTSHFDVIALYSSIERDMRPVAKRELQYIPIFGWVLWLGAAIMIDRGDRRKAVASIERAARTIRGGRSVLMFPEGTRTPAGEVRALKKGPFHLALAAQVPILPVGIEGTGAILTPGDWRIHPGRVTVRVGEPIPTEGLSDDPEARRALMAKVAGALASLSGGAVVPSGSRA